VVVDGFSGAYITSESTLLWLLTTKGVQLCKLHRLADFFCKQAAKMSKVVVAVDVILAYNVRLLWLLTAFPAHI